MCELAYCWRPVGQLGSVINHCHQFDMRCNMLRCQTTACDLQAQSVEWS